MVNKGVWLISAPWSIRMEDLFDSLESSQNGLTSTIASQRLRRNGPNSAQAERARVGLESFARQFTSPLVLVLFVATVISFFVHEWIDAALVLTILFGSAALGFIQEYRASKASEKLKHKLALKSRVLRDSSIKEIFSSQLVPGDVVLLSAGDRIPADGRVIEAVDFLVSEASITGESFPVEKRPGRLAENTATAKRVNFVFQGSSVRSGTASVLVTATGPNTILGGIAMTAGKDSHDTEFTRSVERFGTMLLRVVVVIVLTIFTTNLLLHHPVIDSLLFAVALAVGMSPELLPAVISITLARGARVLARSGVLIRRLGSIENLGAMDVLCADKTGTLTSGQTELNQALDSKGAKSDAVLDFAFLNALFETGIANPLDTAILQAAEKAGKRNATATKVDEIPYDFVRRRLTVVIHDAACADKHLIITKGAFSNVIGICDSISHAGVVSPITEADRTALSKIFQTMGQQGYRVLGLATREIIAKSEYGHSDECCMTFQGFLTFHDPIRHGVREALKQLRELGVTVKVITGDNRYVTAHLAAEAGLDSNTLITGEEIAQMRDEALWARVRSAQLFVEIDPQQKERIVRALQRGGHCVGFVGDGINDVPALEAADVGISVKGAVDVARESADMVLVHAGLDVLRQGIEEGRRTAVNTLKYLAITTSANFGNMVSMAIATPWLPFLALAPKQILLNNFLSDYKKINKIN